MHVALRRLLNRHALREVEDHHERHALDVEASGGDVRGDQDALLLSVRVLRDGASSDDAELIVQEKIR